MQFRVNIEQVDAGWRVIISGARDGIAVDVSPGGGPAVRLLRSVGEGLKTFPQPPEAEADAIPDTADNPYRELCTTTDAGLIRDVYQSILRRRAEDVVRFGRYLFATLLGDALWERLKSLAGVGPRELALTWRRGDSLMNRLPWELMHSSDSFLAQEPELMITRRVAGTTQTLGEIGSPRVLFVVGSDLAKDPNIRPGAEYLGLLRSLKPANRLRLKTHLLLQASPRRLRSAIKWFRPTVVHFICHGGINVQRESFLQLMNDDGSAPEAVDAEGLMTLLRAETGGPLPQIVVLNACYSAADNPDLYMKSGQVSSPLAVRLVEGDSRGGVPVVVGMAGQVADQACRLFTRCFYEAVLGGQEISRAAAAGRRVGIIDEGLTDPRSSLDWALPMLFMSEAVTDPRLTLVPHESESDWHEVTNEFAPPSYPAFCDRLEFFHWFDYLMAQSDAGLYPPRHHTGDLQVIAISVSEKDKKGSDGKLGRTWLLRQFASHAVIDGHLPCLINNEWIENYDEGYPATFEGLIEHFKWSMSKTSELFRLNFNPDCLDLLEEVRAGKKPGDELPPDVQNVYKLARDYGDTRVLSAALRIDLLRLLCSARARRPEAESARTKLLLLVDDIHQMVSATKPLLQFFSSIYGLRSTSAESPGGPTAKSDIRVVCTYDLTAGMGEERTILDWLETAKGVRDISLETFQSPEDRLAYEFFLSCWRDEDGNERPLAVETKAPQEIVCTFFDLLSEKIGGIPSKLKEAPATNLISTFVRLPPPYNVLREMNDEQRLRLIELGGREA